MSELCRNLFLEQSNLVAVLGNGPNCLIFKTCDLGELLSVAKDYGMNDRETDVNTMMLLTQIAGLEVATSHPSHLIMLPCVRARVPSLVARLRRYLP